MPKLSKPPSPLSLPCLYDLTAIERELRVPVAAVLLWAKRGDLVPIAADCAGRPLFRAADVREIGRALAAREPVRLFPDQHEARLRRQHEAAAAETWIKGLPPVA